MRVSGSNVCENKEHLRNVYKLEKRSFMEWQYFFDGIAVAGSILVFQDASRVSFAFLVCAGNDTNN
jgi:hypothetical protein